MHQQWQAGEAVVVRHARDAYRWAAPMHVVEDRGGFVALYLQPGNEVRRMAGPDGEPTRDFYSATTVVPVTWGINHALALMRSGERYAIQLYWDAATWDFRCWYVNFQEPFRRSRPGFETMDLTLDLLIAPDLSGWQWKDEDEFERGIELGWYSRELLDELKAIGGRVLVSAERGDPPFSEPWPDWRPDPDWEPLRLPADWDVDPPVFGEPLVSAESR